jgi:hypothetical protein
LATPTENARPQPAFEPDDEGYQGPVRNRSMVSFIAFVGLLVGTVYLYSLYLDRQVPMIIKYITRNPSTANPPSPSPAVPNNPDIAAPDVPKVPVSPKVGLDSNCALEVDSDPAGATVSVDGLQKGITSAIISSPCNRAINLTIRLEGYETVSENVMVKERMSKHYATLKRVPTGALELVLNRNAKVYIDGKFVREVKSQEKLDIAPLRARQHYSLRFVNEIFGIDVTRDFFIQDNEVLRKNIQLEEPAPGPRSGSRPNRD